MLQRKSSNPKEVIQRNIIHYSFMYDKIERSFKLKGHLLFMYDKIERSLINYSFMIKLKDH